MADEEIVTVSSEQKIPHVHKLGLAAVGMIATFVATNLAEKGYVAVLKAARARKAEAQNAE